jgi:hypothetical protein
MRYGQNLTNLQLFIAWVLYFVLVFIFLIMDAHASTPIDKSESSVPFAKSVELTDGRVLWLHGQQKGDFVTTNGKAATAGLYSSKDGKIAFTVDDLGYLTAPVTDLEERIETVKEEVASSKPSE